MAESLCLTVSRPISARSTPSIVILPSDNSTSRNKACKQELFPAPRVGDELKEVTLRKIFKEMTHIPTCPSNDTDLFEVQSSQSEMSTGHIRLYLFPRGDVK